VEEIVPSDPVPADESNETSSSFLLPSPRHQLLPPPSSGAGSLYFSQSSQKLYPTLMKYTYFSLLSDQGRTECPHLWLPANAGGLKYENTGNMRSLSEKSQFSSFTYI
jgi:hypothetical protein